MFSINSMQAGKKDFENGLFIRRKNPFSREMDCAILEEECRPRLADRERFPSGRDRFAFGSPLCRTSESRDPPDGCHVVLVPLHEPLTRARINKKEQT